MSGVSVEQLVGLPKALRVADAQQLCASLSALWVRQFGRPPGELESDLDALGTYFEPLSQGRRLRKLLAGLPPLPTITTRLLRTPLVLREEDEYLITLEGRAALDLLESLLVGSLNSADIISVSPDPVLWVHARVFARYREWSLRKIVDVLRLASGSAEAEALRLPAVALLLLLLVNGSISVDTALERTDREKPGTVTARRDRLDAAVGEVVTAFCAVLDERERDARHFSLYSGYVPTEARRRMVGILGPESDKLYVLPGQTQRLLDRIVAELRRPQRSPSTEIVLRAFDELVGTYREQLPTFAALGMAHERRSESKRLRENLQRALDGHPGRP